MRHPLSRTALFLLLTAGLVVGVLVGIESRSLPEPAVLLGLFGPALIALVFTFAESGSRTVDLLRQYIRVRASVAVYLIALFTVPVLLLITQRISSFVPAVDYRVMFSALAVPQMIFIPLISIGEELGWRGYLQPMLRERYSLLVASLVVGVTWALWHLPGYYFGTGVVDGVSFGWFFAWVVSGALIMGYLYEQTRSVFIAILFHTSANASFNMILIMPANTGSDLPFKVFTCLAASVGILLMILASRGSAPDYATSLMPDSASTMTH